MSFEGIVEAWPEDGYHENDDLRFNVNDDYDKPKKNKNNSNSKKTLVEIKHEGYTLEKAQPRPGEKPSWARIGQRPLPFDDKTLVDMVKRHRKRKGTTVDEDYKQLTANQQGVLERLLAERNRTEKNKSAEWILYDVQRFGKWKWRTVDVQQIQVIMKRVDRNLPRKNGEYSTKGVKNLYHDFEIIDLAEPSNGNSSKKNKDKKLKKTRSYEDVMNFNDSSDPLGLSMGLPPLPNHGRNNSNQHNHFDQQMPRDGRGQFELPPLPPPLHPPPGAFPQDLNMNGQGQFGQQPFPPQQFHQQHQPHSARQSFTNVNGNPFQPDPNVAPMEQFAFPPTINNDPIFPHPHPDDLQRRPSQGRERRLSTRRQSMGGDPSDIRRLEDKLDNLTIQLSSRKQPGSESSEYDGESVWSYPDDTSWTPPSSPGAPRSHFSRGSLERRRSSASRDSRYPPRYRSHRYSDAEIEPGYSHRSSRGLVEYHRRGKRPSIHSSQSYAPDDYPSGSAAQPRYVPPTAPQAPRPQRRLTDYEDRDRYGSRDYDDRRDSRAFNERYEPRRRDSDYDRRRSQSYVGGGGGGGYFR